MKLLLIIGILSSSFFVNSYAFSAEKNLPTKIEIKKAYESDEYFRYTYKYPNIPQIVDFNIIKCGQTGARNFVDSTGSYKRYDYKCRLILSLDNGVDYEEVLSLYRKGNSNLSVSHSFYKNDPFRTSFP